ncbi:MAG TPA: hypothetical protein VES79_14260 [Solirubrobacteraceae bacterium]|nr:hypothetical protein [Solirubrobacteraceae bacterium]
MDLQRAQLVHRLEAYHEALERLVQLLEAHGDEELDPDEAKRLAEVAAPILHEMRALAGAGAIELSAEAGLAQGDDIPIDHGTRHRFARRGDMRRRSRDL